MIVFHKMPLVFTSNFVHKFRAISLDYSKRIEYTILTEQKSVKKIQGESKKHCPKALLE